MKTHFQTIPDLLQPFPMIFVEGGDFLMGDEHGDLWAECLPLHLVTVSSFYIGQFPVTQALWQAVALASVPESALSSSGPLDFLEPSRFSFPGDERPMEDISWNTAQVFLNKLNVLTRDTRPVGKLYRLPTEAEWEYAARGGLYQSDGYKYSGGDRLKDVCSYNENNAVEIKPVGLKYPNQLGIYDMSGNVWEWCEDDWHQNYNNAPTNNLAWIDASKRAEERVLRGGGALGRAPGCRVAFRFNGKQNFRGVTGFRLVLAPQSVGRSIPALL